MNFERSLKNKQTCLSVLQDMQSYGDNTGVRDFVNRFETALFGYSLNDVSFCWETFIQDSIFCPILFVFYWALFTILFTCLYLISAWFGFEYFYDKKQLNHALFLKVKTNKDIPEIKCITATRIKNTKTKNAKNISFIKNYIVRKVSEPNL